VTERFIRGLGAQTFNTLRKSNFMPGEFVSDKPLPIGRIASKTPETKFNEFCLAVAGPL
jgi:hypothetical protein